jgi:hypothetical protein
MWSEFVVVAAAGRKDSTQMDLAEDDDVIELFPAIEPIALSACRSCQADRAAVGASFCLSFATNSAGVKQPMLECGRTSLKWRRQASIMTLAWARERNHSMLKHSSRNLPLKLSLTPFCQGLPGSIRAVSMPWSTIHLSSARATNSGPLSERR